MVQLKYLKSKFNLRDASWRDFCQLRGEKTRLGLFQTCVVTGWRSVQPHAGRRQIHPQAYGNQRCERLRPWEITPKRVFVCCWHWRPVWQLSVPHTLVLMRCSFSVPCLPPVESHTCYFPSTSLQERWSLTHLHFKACNIHRTLNSSHLRDLNSLIGSENVFFWLFSCQSTFKLT